MSAPPGYQHPQTGPNGWPQQAAPNGRPPANAPAPMPTALTPPVHAEPSGPSNEAAEEPNTVHAWDLVAGGRRESAWVRIRRYSIFAVVLVVLVAGVLSITGQVLDWMRPAAAPPAPVTVTDVQWSGAATVAAVDYLSWDQGDKPARQTALRRIAAANIPADGWDGTGRQSADAPATLGLVRGDGDRAVVTVRVRVVPYAPAAGTTPAAAPSTPQDAGGNIAAAPNPSDGASWTAQPARWVNLAVPLALRGGRLVMTASPVLVGSAPTTADAPALVGNAAAGDAAFAQSTRDTVTTLLRSYGTGDLAYGRASGTTYTGLDKAAVLDSLTDWRIAPLQSGGDGATRVGDATVTWAMSGGAGKLSASYRIELKKQDDRWYLSAISAETEDVK